MCASDIVMGSTHPHSQFYQPRQATPQMNTQKTMAKKKMVLKKTQKPKFATGMNWESTAQPLL